MTSQVHDLEDDDDVGCYFCMQSNATRSNSFKKGEAFLCGPEHSPRDENANYICREHLDSDAILPNGQPASGGPDGAA